MTALLLLALSAAPRPPDPSPEPPETAPSPGRWVLVEYTPDIQIWDVELHKDGSHANINRQDGKLLQGTWRWDPKKRTLNLTEYEIGSNIERNSSYTFRPGRTDGWYGVFAVSWKKVK